MENKLDGSTSKFNFEYKIINYPNYVSYVIVIIVMLFLAYITRFTSSSGDAGIYFTFFKNFFTKPFSYYPGDVSYGATSPLFVIVGTVIYHLGGIYWIDIFRVISFLCCGISLIFINRAINGTGITQLSILSIFLLHIQIIIYTSQLFETPLILLAISMLYYFCKKSCQTSAAIICGLLYLVRPELVILSFSIIIYLFIHSFQRKKFILLAVLSFFPCIVYSIYMFFQTGTLLPSSVTGRLITSIENGNGWAANLIASFTIYATKVNIIVISLVLLAFGLFIFIKLKSESTVNLNKNNCIHRLFSYFPILELIILVSIVLPFVIFPPLNYATRYLTGFIVIGLISIGFLVREISNAIKIKHFIFIFVTLLLIASSGYCYIGYSKYPKPNDKKANIFLALGGDLSEQLNPILKPGNRVLVYEIQHQYSLNAKCISLDAIVGSEATNFLLKKETLTDFIDKYSIDYIITMNSFNYRKIYKGTKLVELYEHDCLEPLNTTFLLGHLKLEKILTNPYFANSSSYELVHFDSLNNNEDTLRVFNRKSSTFPLGHFFWNSVYKVIR